MSLLYWKFLLLPGLVGLLLVGCEPDPVEIAPTATLFVLPSVPPAAEPTIEPILGIISTPTARAVLVTSTASPSPRATGALTPSTGTPSPTARLSPTPAGECVMDALFVDDVTVPDDTVMKPGEVFAKTWRMQNTGTCDWAGDVVLVFLQGTQMATSAEVPVLPTKAGVTVDISVKMTAPTEPGMHFGIWQLRDGDGTPFGMQPYLRIIVQETNPTP